MSATRWLVIGAVSLAGAVVVLALTVGGCSHGDAGDRTAGGAPASELLAPRPTDIGAGNWRALYPLAVGNRWDYRIRWRSTLVTDAGSKPKASGEYSLRVEIVRTEHIGTRDYF